MDQIEKATGQNPDKLADEIAAAVAAERKRCAEIVTMARFGEIERDFRTIVRFIEDGSTVERIKAL